MIDFISGTLIHKNPTRVIVENHGVGFDLNISIQTFQQLPSNGENVRIQTYLHVREDNMQLFGFATVEERQIFTGLIAVAGIGPKLAQTILSGISSDDLVRSIREADMDKLVSISGVGKKTAQRLIVELKEKFMQIGLLEESKDSDQLTSILSSADEEAVMALISLGYKRSAIERALRQVKQNGNPDTVEEMIKQILRVI